jgi:cell division protease FtsH
MEKETISQKDLERICARVVKRKPISPYNGYGKRQPPAAQPVTTEPEPEPVRDSWREPDPIAHDDVPEGSR